MRTITALWYRNLKTFMRNKVQLVLTVVMPFFFLYVFKAIFVTETMANPISYMLAGIVITNVFQTSLSIASSTIDDIVSGFMKEVLVSPVRRMQVAAGQLLSAATIATFQGIITLIVGCFIGVTFTSWITPLAVIAVMALVGLVFSGLGLFIATLIKNSQTFQLVQGAIMMPFTFLCGAYIPLSQLPGPLQTVALFNPMTYTTAFFRTVLLEKVGTPVDTLIVDQLAYKVGDFVVTPAVGMLAVLAFGALFLIASTIVFSRVDFTKINRSKSRDEDVWA